MLISISSLGSSNLYSLRHTCLLKIQLCYCLSKLHVACPLGLCVGCIQSCVDALAQCFSIDTSAARTKLFLARISFQPSRNGRFNAYHMSNFLQVLKISRCLFRNPLRCASRVFSCRLFLLPKLSNKILIAFCIYSTAHKIQ